MTARVRCYDCHRPEAHCLCDLIAPIDHATKILILQHPRERAHAFNTARIVERSLRRAEVIVDHGGNLASDMSLAGRLEGFGLLYPSPGAKDLSQLSPAERPNKLVVLDGTWHHARAMYRDIRPLHDLPHYTLPPGEVSGFRIRKQPRSHCLSTLEAVRSALVCLEPGNRGVDALLRPFEAMQAQHLAAIGSPTPRRKKPKRPREGPTLPPALEGAFDALVVVYAEMSPVSVEAAPRQLLTFAAERPATGERLERIVAGGSAPWEAWPFLRLDASAIRAGTSIDELRRAWRAFQRPGDAMAAWSQSTLDVIEAHLGASMPTVAMKGVYCDRRRFRGCLEQIVAKEELFSRAALEHNQSELSRTEERLGNAVAVARLLHRHGSAPASPTARRPSTCG